MLHTINKMKVQLNDKGENASNVTETPAQICLRQHMDAIADLPADSRLAMERDIINLLLNEELSNKKSNHSADVEKAINDETEEFLRDISFQKVLDLAYSVKHKTSETEHHSIMSSKTSNNSQKAIKSSPPPAAPAAPAAPALPVDHVNTKQKISHRIRKCQVRIKRINIEDYIPLKFLNEFPNRNRNFNRRQRTWSYI